MSVAESRPLSREVLLDYFLQAARPADDWLVGMELEKMGRAARDGSPLPYEGAGPSVLEVLGFFQTRRGGDPILEGDHLIGLDAPWGTITLEPGGQVEWSSRPARSLPDLRASLDEHLAAMRAAETELAVRWLDTAVDPELRLESMPWMPKARYGIMRPYLGARGRLAHRMMTQTASIQCAFDYADPEDWREKFKLGALMAPLATALFANSPRLDGRETGWHAYRAAIWQETDPARCGLPPVVFEPGFGLQAWLDYVLDVPTIFRHRSRGLVPAGGVPFAHLLDLQGCDAVHYDDWETHVSTIFTEVRSYTYIEVRSADLQPDDLAIAVPTFWTGLLYHEGARREAHQLLRSLDDHAAWSEALAQAGRLGLEARGAGWKLSELATQALRLAVDGLRGGAFCAGDPGLSVPPLLALAERHGLSID